MINYNTFFITSLAFISSCTPFNHEKVADVSSEKPKKVTIEQVEKGIRANISDRVKEGGGFFHFKKDTINLSLKLVRVHTEYLSVLGSNRFFACVDLATENGDVYDVDFFLEGTAEDMEVVQTDVHKLNGKPYYSWKQNKKTKTWYTVPMTTASNDLLGVIEDKDAFTFTYVAEIPKLTKASKMWLPIATTDEFQNIEILEIKSPVKYQIMPEKAFGNSVFYAELQPEQSEQRITIHYQVKRKEKGAYSEKDIHIEDYLGGSPLIPVGDRFSIIAQAAIKERQADTPLTKARALYDYIIDNMRYAKQGVYGTGDANYACDSKSGNCTEFHSFFISLTRSVGIPSRFAVGASIPSERNEGGVNGYHCWAEFYAEGKWWPVDISEANKYTALATYYFGHHPANRIEFSKGRDLLPVPAPVSGPINFLAYPLLEVNGKPEFVKTTFTFSRISIEAEAG